jgi:hypothetical protein
MSNIESAIDAASSDNPSEFKDHIQNALMDKLSGAIDLKKIEIGAQYLQPEDPTIEPMDEPEETVELSNEDD